MCCFGEASYTKRISHEKEVEVIGGAEMYMAVCRQGGERHYQLALNLQFIEVLTNVLLEISKWHNN